MRILSSRTLQARLFFNDTKEVFFVFLALSQLRADTPECLGVTGRSFSFLLASGQKKKLKRNKKIRASKQRAPVKAGESWTVVAFRRSFARYYRSFIREIARRFLRALLSGARGI